MLTHPHVLPETHRTETHIHRQSYQFFPSGVPLVITSSYLINTWLDMAIVSKQVIVSCLFTYKCTVVPVVLDRVACILSTLLNCQLLNLRSLCYYFSANCEQNVMDIRKYLGKRTLKEQSDKSSGEESDTEESLCHGQEQDIHDLPRL